MLLLILMEARWVLHCNDPCTPQNLQQYRTERCLYSSSATCLPSEGNSPGSSHVTSQMVVQKVSASRHRIHRRLQRPKAA